MRIKLVPILLASALLLCSCGKEEVPEETSITTTVTTVDPRLEEVEVLPTSSESAVHYKDFLKYGGITTEELSAGEFAEFSYTAAESKETWEKIVDESDMTTYWRDSSSMQSCYTATFPVETEDITRWMAVELDDLDAIFAMEHVRDKMEGATYYYHWESDSEDCKLQVYSTGETGKYIALVSFTRVGPTTYDQMMGTDTTAEPTTTEGEEVHSHD